MSGLYKLYSFVAVLSLLLAAGCGSSNSSGTGVNGGSSGGGGGNGGGTSSAPVVTSFAVSPAIAATAQFTNFTWTTANATAFSTNPNLAQENQTLPVNCSPSCQQGQSIPAPASTTTYTATATSAAGTSQPVTTTLTVVPMTLTASATTIPAGQSVTLTYTGPNNGSVYTLVTIPSNGPPLSLTPSSCSGSTCTGTYNTGPLGISIAYQVSAAGPVGGQAFSPQVSITVVGAMTLTFTANPKSIQSGQSSTLTWQTKNAASLTIDQGVCQSCALPNGSAVVRPTQTTTYTATATDHFGGKLSVPATVTVSTGGISNLNHIIFMVQENRAFDNYFGQLAYYRVNIDHIPGAQMSDVNDLHNLPSGYTIKNPQGQSFPPFHARTECIENLSPSWDESHVDMDLKGGDWMHLSNKSFYYMDKFLFTTLSGGSGDQYDPTHSRPLGYYDWTDLPFYYELAAQFSTSDSWYSPIPANTVPNRMYLFAATSYGHGYPVSDPSDPVWQQPTIFRALKNAGVTWRYYYQDNSVFLANWADWNDPQIQGNVRNIQEWYNILASPDADKQLPEVVFIERASGTGLDEHPENNVQKGAADVEQIMAALMQSAAWPDSVFILTYDEGGGVFDHVGPILVTPPDGQLPNDIKGHIQGLFNVTGFRVPMIVVSPWVKPHFVSHLQTDYTAMLKLIETRFGVPPLTKRDATTGDMTDPAEGFFDFSAPNLLQIPPLPTQPTNGTCDYKQEGYK